MENTRSNRLIAVISGTLSLLLIGTAVTLALIFGSQPAKEQNSPMLGFCYDPEEDIFYSDMDAWQKKAGYCKLYDDVSPAMNMIIDCEPVYFDYGGRHWLIEFWKGQYGVTAGGEIGVYYTKKNAVTAGLRPQDLFYSAAKSNHMPYMSMEIRKNGETMFERSGAHWWLTGFKLGEFAPPDTLTANIIIRMPIDGMREAFVDALQTLGYNDANLAVAGTDVFLVYELPYSPQPAARQGIETAVLSLDGELCREYITQTADVEGTEQKLAFLKDANPALYRAIVSTGRGAAQITEFR